MNRRPAPGLAPLTCSFCLLTALIGILFAVDRSCADRYFAIRANDKLIGYASVSTREARQGDRPVSIRHSHTAIKVSLLGTKRETTIDSKTTVDARTLAPLRLSLTLKTNHAARHIDAEVSGGRISLWNYGDGEDRGAPKEFDVPAGTLLLGSNVFDHWDLLLGAAKARANEGKATLTTFMPELGRTREVTFIARGSQSVELAGRKIDVDVWKLEGSDIEIWADAATAQLVRMDLPSQRTVVEATTESAARLAEKSHAEEVLADLFAPSNVRFDDMLAVRRLKARIKARVIGEGQTNDLAILQTSMQTFVGKKEDATVEGIVEIRSVRYDPATSPPLAAPISDALERWTAPSQYIESDDPEIGRLAKKLTRDAKSRWDAVKRIGTWVYREIRYTIADTPSAEMALKKKEGDCGPHSTLMIAMLRSLGIPAKLVGGVVYTPSFGGTFGQHAWVEVQMGPAGWIAVDPTTGEFETLSAVHIKLFEGLGGARTESIEVLEYDPPNREFQTVTPKEVRAFPWKTGVTYRVNYVRGDSELGTESFVIRKVERDGSLAYELKDDLELKINALVSLTSTSRLLVRPDMRPLSLDRTLKALRETRIVCRFEEGKVEETISGSRDIERTIKVPSNVYCFDNNFIGSFVLICSQLELQVGQSIRIETFHPSSLQVIPLTITPREKDTIDVGGKPIECLKCKVDPIANTFWIAGEGRLLRVSQGRLTMTIEGDD